MNKLERKRMLCVSLATGAILLCGVLLVLLMRYQHTSTVRPQDQYLGQIPAFYSTVDADGDGVPYIIHHNDPWQAAYEQDILEKRTDIVGHYRISE